MSGSNTRHGTFCCLLAGLGLLSAATTGCQVQVGGQTIPSAYYMTDDVQYYASGPEFKLTNEAAALQAAKAEQASQAR